MLPWLAMLAWLRDTPTGKITGTLLTPDALLLEAPLATPLTWERSTPETTLAGELSVTLTTEESETATRVAVEELTTTVAAVASVVAAVDASTVATGTAATATGIARRVAWVLVVGKLANPITGCCPELVSQVADRFEPAGRTATMGPSPTWKAWLDRWLFTCAET